MISRTTREFRRLFAQLPEEIQQRARQAYRLFQENPRHPSLRFRKLQATDSDYSIRINAQYRAVGRMNDGVIIWHWIGPHHEYDRLVS